MKAYLSRAMISIPRHLFPRSIEELLRLAISICDARFGAARITGEAPITVGPDLPDDVEEALVRLAPSEDALLVLLDDGEIARAGVTSLRFYAGVTLLDEEGKQLGTFTVFDDRPRSLTEAQKKAFLGLAAQAVRDVEMATAIHHAEQERAAWRPLIHHAPVAAFTYCVDSARFSYVNAKFAETLGYAAEEILALDSVTDIIPEDQREAVREMIRRREAGDDREVWYTTKVRCFNGTLLDAEIHSSIAGVDGGRMVIGVAIDITERQRMERQLAQFDRLTSLGRLSAQIAHEFNNVLMGIQPVAEAIRRRAGDDPDLLKFTDCIAASVKRGKRLTTDVLRFGRPAELLFGSVDVRMLFRQTADEIRPLLGGRIHLDVSSPDGLFAHGDAAQLTQVLINLALNARDAMEAGDGTLTLEACKATESEIADPGRFLRISVRDTGAGIAGDDLPYIFEPLFTTKKRGTGLGLSVAFQVVAAHGGRIVVESEAGKGTSFHLFVPSAASLRVLIVDDDDSVAMGLRWSIEAAGMEAQIVATGAEVLPAIEAWHPDVVVLDLSLPDEDGRAVYERIAARYVVPVVFSSGHVSDADLPELLKIPRSRFLMKPYHTDALIGAIRELAKKA